jgi:hypothetical protein
LILTAQGLGLALLLHVGSPQSKKAMRKRRRSSTTYSRRWSEKAEKIIKALENKYPVS